MDRAARGYERETIIVMSKEDAKFAVESELERRNPIAPLTAADVLIFCSEMYNKLEFLSKDNRVDEIRGWTERWLMTRFPSTRY